MFVLAIDTSSAAVTAGVAVVTDRVDLIAENTALNARGHGELLAPLVRDSLADAGLAPGDLAAVVVGTGPGPFTGLRVGLVTAAAVSDALGIPAYGVCSLDAVAFACRDEADLLVVTDARRKEVYWARYADGARADGPHVAKPADVPAAATVTGRGTALYPDVWPAGLGIDYPSPHALVSVAADRIRDRAPADPLTPLYLRRPDAVEPGAPKAVTQ